MVLLRHKLFVDGDIQGLLLRRVGLYGFACSLYFAIILLLAESMAHPDEPWLDGVFRAFDEAIYWVPGLAVLAPIIAYDLLRVSNRFVGPMFRLRRELRRLAKGESVENLTFREDDYWCEMADLFNQVRGEMEQLRTLQKALESVPADDNATEESVPTQSRLFHTDEDDAPNFLAANEA